MEHKTLFKTDDIEVKQSERGTVSFSYSNAGDAMCDLYARVAELEHKEDTASTDVLDLMRDDFKRIHSCPDVSSEVKGLCDRAVGYIEQRIPVIEQRDLLQLALNRAVLERDKLKAKKAQNSARMQIMWKWVLHQIGLVPPREFADWFDGDGVPK